MLIEIKSDEAHPYEAPILEVVEVKLKQDLLLGGSLRLNPMDEEDY